MADVRLKVMSYNVGGHGARWSRSYVDRVARAIAEAEPDVVGLQEIHRSTRHSRLEDQAESLARLTGMSVHFGKSFDVSAGGEFGNAVLTTGEVRSGEVVPLPGTGERRTVLHSRLAVAGSELDFYVTHLAAWGRWGRTARSVQISGLLKRLKEGSEPFVLVGDLNAPPGAPEMRTLLAAEVFRMCGEDMACTHRYMRQRIDYVFADPGWTTTGYEVVRVGPSDHWPVLVELHRSEPVGGPSDEHAPEEG